MQAETEERKKAMQAETEERKKAMRAEEERRKKEAAEEDRRRKKEAAEREQRRKESEREYQEMRENSKERERQLNQTIEALKQQKKRFDEASGYFDNKWGTFMENLLNGCLVNLLKSKGIAVTGVIRYFQIEDENKQIRAEFDLVAINGKDLVVVEVKSTLTHEKVDKFVKKIEQFKTYLPTYREGKNVYGAMGYLEIYERSKRYKKKSKGGKWEDSGKIAMEKGLWLIEAPAGDADFAKIVNSKDFIPREF